MSEETPQENAPVFVPPVSTFTGPVGELIAQRMLAPPPRLGVLAMVDHYEIIRVLGGGGMGIVLLARDLATGREVAVKLVKSDLVTNQHAVHSFLKETGHLKRLRHTNIMPVEEISDRPEGPYFVMPYFEKGSLASRIKPGRPLDTESILDISIQVAEGLSFAHRSGIIHRDLKPANILLGANGGVCLADFGLARTMFNDTVVDVENRQLEGTAPYVSPAIAAGDAEDTRCDIYSFGALLYEMLTGQPPYQGRGTREILAQILAGPPKPISALNPAADRGLVIVAEGCMARELRNRYADMRDVLNDLRRIQQGKLPIGQREIIETHRTPKALLAVVCLMGIALLGWAGWMFSRERSHTAIIPAQTNYMVSKPMPASNTVAPLSLPVVKTAPTNPIVPTTTPAQVTAATSAISTLNTTTTIAKVSIPVESIPPPVKPLIQTVPGPLVVQPNLQPIVRDIAQLATNGLNDVVISTYARANLPVLPLTVAEMDYLRARGVSQSVIDILRQGRPVTIIPTNQPVYVTPNPEVHALLKTANEKYSLHEHREAIAYCNRVLKLDPDNPDAWCIKATSEEALHNSASAIAGFSTFLNLPAAQTPQYSAWRSYASTRLRALRGW